MVVQSKCEDRLKASLASDSEDRLIWWTPSVQSAIVWWKIASVQEPVSSARPAEREGLSEREKPALVAQTVNNPPATVPVNVQPVNIPTVTAGAAQIVKAIPVSAQNSAAPANNPRPSVRAAWPAVSRPVSVVEIARNQTVESAAPGAC